MERRTGQARLGHRSPIAKLAYCGPENQELCVVSFTQVEGAMQVHLQVPNPFYPELILIIDRYEVESRYECQRAEGLTASVTCQGPPQAPGEILQFKLYSRNHGTLLAAGKFSIIGIALSTLEISPTATPEGVLTETPTATLPPTPSRATPSPSYPNPTYP